MPLESTAMVLYENGRKVRVEVCGCELGLLVDYVINEVPPRTYDEASGLCGRTCGMKAANAAPRYLELIPLIGSVQGNTIECETWLAKPGRQDAQETGGRARF